MATANGDRSLRSEPFPIATQKQQRLTLGITHLSAAALGVSSECFGLGRGCQVLVGLDALGVAVLSSAIINEYCVV